MSAAEPSPEGQTPSRPPLEAVLLTPGVVEAIRALVEIMDQGGLTRIDLAHGDLSIHLRGGGEHPRHESAPRGLPEIHHALEASPPPPTPPAETPADGGYVVTSPMVGTYYASPSPGAPAFVQVGDHVEAGQTVGIVEAMKIMNEITAEQSGIVAAIFVENGQAVEYGSPLIRLDRRAGRDGGPPAGIGGLA